MEISSIIIILFYLLNGDKNGLRENEIAIY